MCIEVGGGGQDAVPQPLLNLNERRPVLNQQGGAGMAEVMQANLTQPMILEKLFEVLTEIARVNRHSSRIQANIFVRWRRPHLILPHPFCSQSIPERFRHRQGTVAGSLFNGVPTGKYVPVVHLLADAGVLDPYDATGKVDVPPL